MLAIFHVSGKTPYLSEDLKIWTRGSAIEFPVCKHLSVFINNKGSLLLFSKGVHWEAKTSLKIFAFSTTSEIRIGGTERILILFKKLLKTVQ